MKTLLFVANWKMYLSFKASLEYVTQHHERLAQLAQDPYKRIVLCPSFLAAPLLVQLFAQTGVYIGAQSCSPYEAGAHTGQINALSISQSGIPICIIGHSEERAEYELSDDYVARQCEQLIMHNLFPIVCVGEDSHSYKSKRTKDALIKQLDPIFSIAQGLQEKLEGWAIAYEPIWAIGTGSIPEPAEIQEVCSWIKEEAQRRLEKAPLVLYGGSVTPENAEHITNLAAVDGLLIGKSSTDFQTFQKIVSLG